MVSTGSFIGFASYSTGFTTFPAGFNWFFLCPGPCVRRRVHGPGKVIGPKGARLRPTTTNWGLPHLPYCNQNCSVLASLGVPLHSCCVLCPGSGICCTGSCLDRIGCRTGFTGSRIPCTGSWASFDAGCTDFSGSGTGARGHGHRHGHR